MVTFGPFFMSYRSLADQDWHCCCHCFPNSSNVDEPKGQRRQMSKWGWNVFDSSQACFEFATMSQ